MPDNVTLPGTGEAVRTVTRAGIETQVVLVDRSNGSAGENLGYCGSKTFSDPAPSAAAALQLAANASRKCAVIYNNGTQTVYLGKDSSVTTSNGMPLLAGATLVDDHSVDAWWGITASGTGDLRIYEVA